MSELATRTLSGLVMIAVALAAVWLSGWTFALLALVIGGAVLVEWRKLRTPRDSLSTWMALGASYIGAALVALVWLRFEYGFEFVLTLLASVWAVDIGAYAFGRTIGGPKIAPSISPSKTWAGLLGGVIGACLVFALTIGGWHALFGVVVAVLAQLGDFFESWLKRRAGLKDSGGLIPGHGGVFDRVDGVLPVAILAGAAMVAM